VCGDPAPKIPRPIEPVKISTLTASRMIPSTCRPRCPGRSSPARDALQSAARPATQNPNQGQRRTQAEDQHQERDLTQVSPWVASVVAAPRVGTDAGTPNDSKSARQHKTCPASPFRFDAAPAADVRLPLLRAVAPCEFVLPVLRNQHAEHPEDAGSDHSKGLGVDSERCSEGRDEDSNHAERERQAAPQGQHTAAMLLRAAESDQHRGQRQKRRETKLRVSPRASATPYGCRCQMSWRAPSY